MLDDSRLSNYGSSSENKGADEDTFATAISSGSKESDTVVPSTIKTI